MADPLPLFADHICRPAGQSASAGTPPYPEPSQVASGSTVADQSPDRHAARIHPVSHGRVPRSAGVCRDLIVSLKRLLQDQLVQRQIRHRLLETCVLLLQIPPTTGLIHPHPAVLPVPTIIRMLWCHRMNKG